MGAIYKDVCGWNQGGDHGVSRRRKVKIADFKIDLFSFYFELKGSKLFCIILKFKIYSKYLSVKYYYY